MSKFFEKFKKVVYETVGSRSFVSAVILAGGSGTRVGAGQTKQMLVLDGKPLIVHTLLAFEQSEYVDEIVVVAKEDEVAQYDAFRETYSITKLTKVVVGGSTRQQSAKNGFDAINEQAAYVAIHDGARALITPQQIKDVLMTAFAHGAAIAACPATDTVKYAEGTYIGETVPREHIWLAGTPQIFRDEVYRAAAYVAVEEDFEGTDDASLVENIGIRVHLVDVGPDNFKVTYKNDLLRAELLLKQRKETVCE